MNGGGWSSMKTAIGSRRGDVPKLTARVVHEACICIYIPLLVYVFDFMNKRIYL